MNSRNFIIFFRLIRLKNLVMIAITQAMVKCFLIDRPHHVLQSVSDTNLWALIASTLCITASGYIINDYFDVKLDLVNKPNQVYVGRSVRRRWAMFFHQRLNLLGISLGILLAKSIFLVELVVIALLWFYSERFKKQFLIGNVVVAFLSALSILLLSLYYPQNQNLVLLYALFAFFMTLIREIIKDIEDIRGDARYGCKTIPIVMGIAGSKKILFGLITFFCATLLLIAYKLNQNDVLIAFVGITMLLIWFGTRLYEADKKKHFTQLSSLAKVIMLLGIGSMVFV